MLADRGEHRSPSIPDLLIAATAEKAGPTVLAADKDLNLIVAITGQLSGTGAALVDRPSAVSLTAPSRRVSDPAHDANEVVAITETILYRFLHGNYCSKP